MHSKPTLSALPLFLFCLLLFSGLSCREAAPTLPIDLETLEANLRPALKIKGEAPFIYNLSDRMVHHKVPGVSIVLINEGKVVGAKGYGVTNTVTQRPVDTETLFQAGSISKPLAALGALKLVEEGKIELDTDVNTYLKGWKVPDNHFTQAKKVTLRGLLTHTAGLTVHGFPGYTYEDTIPTVVEVLNGAGNTSAILPDTTPGSIWRYSGGGYTVMQKMVEDVSGQSFEAYLANEVLGPMGMENSTYEQPLPNTLHENASAAFNGKGEMAEGLWNNYPEKAAAGLWTTPTDLAKYCLEIQQAYAGKSAKVLSQQSVKDMLTKHKNDWGLGPGLGGDGDTFSFGHGGKNRGFSNDMIALVHKGQGIIVMTNADNGTKLNNEIMAAAALMFRLGIYQQKEVKRISLSEDELRPFAGKYKLLLPGVDDYIIEFTIKGDEIEVYDPEEETRSLLFPSTSTLFYERDNGADYQFKQNKDDQTVAGFRYRNRYDFEKVE